MSIAIARGNADEALNSIVEALRPYEMEHPNSRIELYKQNPATIRVRVVDPSFQGLERHQRYALVWDRLENLNEDVLAEISMLLLLTPDETKKSLANLEFEQPSKSIL